MTDDRIRALEGLLAAAEEAHGVYETSELNGVYDEGWPRWYAQYALDHGIRDVLGRNVTVDELAAFLAVSWDEAQGADPRPTEPWPAYTARRLAGDL